MTSYLVIHEKAENNYSAYAPDLPGCVACADTQAETEQLMKEAIELYIEALRGEGIAVPEPTTEARTLTVAVRRNLVTAGNGFRLEFDNPPLHILQ